MPRDDVEPDPAYWDMVSREQQLLSGDADLAIAHGSAHPEVYGGMWWEGPRLQVGFTVLGPVADELRRLLTHPDKVDIVEVPRSEQNLRALREDIQRELDDAAIPWMDIGLTERQVCVGLRAGGHPYPPGPDPVPPVAGPRSTAVRPDLAVAVEPHSTQIAGGHGPRGTVVIRNRGTVATKLGTPTTLIATLLDNRGNVAGSFSGWLTDDALHWRLAPGEAARVPFVGGTGCGPPDYVTPPGEYGLVVVLPLRAADSELQIVTEPVTVRVLPVEAEDQPQDHRGGEA